MYEQSRGYEHLVVGVIGWDGACPSPPGGWCAPWRGPAGVVGWDGGAVWLKTCLSITHSEKAKSQQLLVFHSMVPCRMVPMEGGPYSSCETPIACGTHVDNVKF